MSKTVRCDMRFTATAELYIHSTSTECGHFTSDGSYVQDSFEAEIFDPPRRIPFTPKHLLTSPTNQAKSER